MWKFKITIAVPLTTLCVQTQHEEGEKHGAHIKRYPLEIAKHVNKQSVVTWERLTSNRPLIKAKLGRAQ